MPDSPCLLDYYSNPEKVNSNVELVRLPRFTYVGRIYQYSVKIHLVRMENVIFQRRFCFFFFLFFEIKLTFCTYFFTYRYFLSLLSLLTKV